MTVELKSTTMSKTCSECGHINILITQEIPVLEMSITIEGKLRLDKYDVSLNCTECGHNLLEKEMAMAKIAQWKVEDLLPTMWD